MSNTVNENLWQDCCEEHSKECTLEYHSGGECISDTEKRFQNLPNQ